MKESITKTLRKTLVADYVHVVDDSHKHSNHRSNSINSHFDLTIVSTYFEGLSLVKRHKIVYKSLDEYIENGVHALTMKTYTPIEWKEGKHGK